MDNFSESAAEPGPDRWAPRTAGLVGCAAAGVLLAALGLIDPGGTTDAPGRLLALIGATGLLGFAALSWRARPRLAIEEPAREGSTPADSAPNNGAVLVVRGWFRTRVLRRADVAAVRITEFRRLARRVRLLEIETADDDLIVLSRWELGCNPIEVLDALIAAGFGTRPVR